MPTEKHYVVEQLEDGQYAVRAIRSNHAGFMLQTQREANDRVSDLNPDRSVDALKLSLAEVESAADDHLELATAERKPATAEKSAKATQSRRAR